MSTTPEPQPDPRALHEPATAMYACRTVDGTAAAETAVCGEHRDGFTPSSPEGDIEDFTLVDCTANEALVCQVCGARAAGAEQ